MSIVFLITIDVGNPTIVGKPTEQGNGAKSMITCPFGEWLYLEIAKLKPRGLISVTEFGRRAEISPSQLYRYLTDECRPSKDALQRICKALDAPFARICRRFYKPKKVGRPKTTGKSVKYYVT